MEETLLELMKRAVRFLEQRGVPRPKCDVEWMFSTMLGCQRLALYLNGHRTISPHQKQQLRTWLQRRAQREPLQYILEKVEFYGLSLHVDPRVLIPRPETEFLVDWLCTQQLQQPKTILDLGTGSGAIAIALSKHFPETQVVAVDISADALEVAQENARHHQITNIHFIISDWFKNIPQQRFDWIIANPPYLTAQEYETAEAEVRQYEPKNALVAEQEGLQHLDQILQAAPQFLQPRGMVALETGILHPHILQERYQTNWKTKILQDLTYRDRFFIAINDR